jgi:hypothetical protein
MYERRNPASGFFPLVFSSTEVYDLVQHKVETKMAVDIFAKSEN